eukprot:CAMPEP_0115827680 /NCGR_PEP_ID=MMETSP0287-20121206/173_1 /TAXON_ID=412157 /ORGANISM="Chrysochromulina rotalis, Strain UIO044" /LENGTH=259 /DNA_ID=CAMNT_0003280853 /DNA_START=415 /DNA_END=1196 /DNA_ORIENTATION=-
MVETLATALRASLCRTCGRAHGAKVAAAVALAREAPPYEEETSPARRQQLRLLRKLMHPTRTEQRVILQDEEAHVVMLWPAAHDVLEEHHVADIGTDCAPSAEDATPLCLVEVQMLLHATLKVARVRLEQVRSASDRRPTLVAHTTATELALHKSTPTHGVLSIDEECHLEEYRMSSDPNADAESFALPSEGGNSRVPDALWCGCELLAELQLLVRADVVAVVRAAIGELARVEALGAATPSWVPQNWRWYATRQARQP